LVGQLAGELTPGLLGGLQPVGKLVDRGGEGGELRTHSRVDDARLKAPISKSAGDIRRVGDRSREALRNQPTDRGGRHTRDEDAHSQGDQDRFVERAGDMFKHQLVRRRLDTVEMGLEDSRADQQGRDQDRTGPGQDHEQVVEDEPRGQAQCCHPRSGLLARHPDPIR
jgi:hypothetical protein